VGGVGSRGCSSVLPPSIVAVQGGVRGGHTFLETSTHVFPIFSCIFNGFFMFDLLLLFRPVLPGGVA
jgi:hypothetical protein